MRIESFIEKFEEEIIEDCIHFLHEKDRNFFENKLAYETGTYMDKIKELLVTAIKLTKEKRLDIIENRLKSIGVK